jgi:hypothetical protein
MAASMRSTVLTAYQGSQIGSSETGLARMSESGAKVPTTPIAKTITTATTSMMVARAVSARVESAGIHGMREM